jgi:ketosteroid isomerase-like protein
MSTNEAQIRELIEGWAEAVHAGEMARVLADHAADILMFDVPPPYDGVRGIDAYRDTWPGFFEWQAQGAVFEIDTLEITAGEDVAFAQALLRCGTKQELDARPGYRLRLTLGLRKENGRWVVAHEHHSFPDTDDRESAEQDIRELLLGWFDSTAAKDLDAMMAGVDEDVVSYEHDGALQYVGLAAVREVCQRGLDAATGTIRWEIPDLRVLVRGDLAIAWGLDHLQIDGTETHSRGTRVFQRKEGHWLLIHQHLSSPAI